MMHPNHKNSGIQQSVLLRMAKAMLFWLGVAVMGLVGTAHAQGDVRVDIQNCLLCHRYPGMGRFDDKGVKRIFYINDLKFANSVHGKLRCTNCHVGLDRIPHTDINKVDCTTKCHIKEPSTEREFSHENMAQKYEPSVHGSNGQNRVKPHPEDLPTCKYCHQNQIRGPVGGWGGVSEAMANETLSRCIGCHTKDQWAQNFYLHFTHRLRRIRSPEEIVALCTSCHEDREKMSRHGLDNIETFKDTFHWHLVKFKVKNAPDCISCHVPLGYTTHDIRPKKDPNSSINEMNRVNTCSNQGGIQACHPRATEDFARGRVHAYGAKARLATGGHVNAFKDNGESLLMERAQKEFSEQEKWHFKILLYIRLFYKMLIPLVIGFMLCHQGLDFITHVRKRH